MRQLAIAQLGSNVLDQIAFWLLLKLNNTKRVLPFLIQKHFEKNGDKKLLEYKAKFESLIELDKNL